ncbi:hypothetical protein G9A89_006113 [Geosiphon pyriformis]|nr:hypothetical protein G9A89_006113 [Geosiphon pyriformis]
MIHFLLIFSALYGSGGSSTRTFKAGSTKSFWNLLIPGGHVRTGSVHLAISHRIPTSQAYTFTGLAVDKDADSKTVHPHQYLILSLEFSAVNCRPNPGVAKAGLFNMINTAIRKFYMTYVTYLGDYNGL